MSPSTGPRYGVVGNPIAHSLSPRIHAAFAEQTGQVLVYERVLAPLDGFLRTAQDFFVAGGRGINVTVPFKLEARALCGARVSPRAAVAGAVNCIAADEGGIHGDNTDGVGLVNDLSRILRTTDRSLTGSRLLLLGAGGAARGVLGPLVDAGPRSIVVVNRDAAKAEALVRDHASIVPVEARTLEAIGDEPFDIVVNATSASLGGAPLALPSHVSGNAHLVYDMMYGAAPTPFLEQAARAGATVTADGLGMLVEQAAESFLIWRGVRPQTGPVRDALRALLEASLGAST